MPEFHLTHWLHICTGWVSQKTHGFICSVPTVVADASCGFFPQVTGAIEDR
jgi:hypothetical protein